MNASTVLQTDGGVKAQGLAALSYLGFLCFVPLFVNKDDEYVYFHAKQGLVIWGLLIVSLLTLYVPGIGKAFFSIAFSGVLLLSAAGLVAVGLNRAWKLPLISDWADRI